MILSDKPSRFEISNALLRPGTPIKDDKLGLMYRYQIPHLRSQYLDGYNHMLSIRDNALLPSLLRLFRELHPNIDMARAAPSWDLFRTKLIK